jgi:hypothetical protein
MHCFGSNMILTHAEQTKATLDGVVCKVFETSGVGQATPMPESNKGPGVHCGMGLQQLTLPRDFFQSRHVRAWPARDWLLFLCCVCVICLLFIVCGVLFVCCSVLVCLSVVC